MDYPRLEQIKGPQDRRHIAYQRGGAVERALKMTDLVVSTDGLSNSGRSAVWRMNLAASRHPASQEKA